jgi:hypothetical protein
MIQSLGLLTDRPVVCVAQTNQKTGAELLQLLALPLSHFSGIGATLEDMQHSERPGSLQAAHLQTACTVMREAGALVQKKLSESETTSTITQVQRRLTGSGAPFNLIVPHRRFIREGQVSLNSKKHQLFLFNDMLLITRLHSNGSCEMVKQAPVDTLTIEECADKNTFGFKCGNESFRFTTKAAEDKMIWTTAVSGLLNMSKLNRGPSLLSIAPQANTQ